MNPVVASYFSQYVSPEGLGLLGPGHRNNDNGILFHAMALMLMYKLNMLPDGQKFAVENTLKNLQVVGVSGLYNRRPNDVTPERHDNYVGIEALIAIFKIKDEADYIYRHGESTGYCYNNSHPFEFEIESQRQGGDVAFYKLCAGKRPTPWEALWLFLGVIFSITLGNISSINLSWLRLETLKLIEMPQTYKTILAFTDALFSVVRWIKYGNQTWIFKQYFAQNHPIIRLSEMTYGP